MGGFYLSNSRYFGSIDIRFTYSRTTSWFCSKMASETPLVILGESDGIRIPRINIAFNRKRITRDRIFNSDLYTKTVPRI